MFIRSLSRSLALSRSLVVILLLISSAAIAQNDTPSSVAAEDKLAPIMLDDLHYYSVAHDKMKAFFITHFGAKPMPRKRYRR